MKTLLTIALTLSLTYLTANALVDNTKHNLSITGPGTTKAQTEDQVCAFCHIPHSARQGSPLWNREMPTSDYTMYDSTYLRRTGYPIPAGLGSTTGTPGVKSRMCLSCHDGTVAVGGVYILRGSILGEAIAMQGVEGIGTIPAASAAHIGTDLSNHHPVGYKYDSTVASPDQFDVGDPVTTELKATPDAPIKLYTYGVDEYVECSSCHDPHTENAKFLRMGDDNVSTSHAANVLNTCVACHDKGRGVPWGGGSHESAGMSYKKAFGSSVPDKYNDGADISVGELWCVNCHTPHSGEGKPALLRKVEQNTCYRGAEDDSVVNPAAMPCHQSGQTGGAVRRMIEPVVNRTYGHPVGNIDNVHTGLDALYGVPNPDAGKGVDWATSRHAECVDCHNPHMAGSNMHVEDTEWYPTAPGPTTNNVSDVLRNVSGVEPTWPSLWTQPTAFTTMRDSEKEYQICLKCHSYWGLGTATFGVSSFTLSVEGDPVTDQAWEFNPNNRSAHPVVVTVDNMPNHYAPGLLATNLKAPWNVNIGNQTMYCSDCHGAEDEDTVDAKGPHGSSKKYMLKGVGKYWPENPSGDLWNVDNAVLVPNNDLFCQNCHNTELVAVHQWKAQAGQFGAVVCVNCHVTVPHGSPVSRLMGYDSFPTPYDYNNNSLMLQGYKKPTDAGSNSYAYAPACGGGAMCHDNDAGGYDTVP